MLKHRVITAIGLLSIFVLVLFFMPPIYWAAFVAVVVLLGMYEWLQLASVKSVVSKSLLYGALLVAIYSLYQQLIPIKIIVYVSALLWVILISGTLVGKPRVLFSQSVKLVIAVWLLATTWWLLNILRLQSHGELWVLFFLGIIWCADIGAYFSGKRFGKNKLAPHVSPGKTIEGLVGGLIAVSLLSILVIINTELKAVWMPMLLLCLITGLVSVGGDLYESQLKRQANMKDSSNILPGHGGILDRVDSILAGLPFFIAGLLLLKLLPDVL